MLLLRCGLLEVSTDCLKCSVRPFDLAGQNFNVSLSCVSFSHCLVHSSPVVVLSLAAVLGPALGILAPQLNIQPKLHGDPKANV